MKASSGKIQSIIENTFVSAIEELTRTGAGNIINDLYVQVDLETGELQIYDDSETLLGRVVIFDWMNKKEQADNYQKQIVSTLKAVLNVLSTKKVFEDSCFMKPLSVSLTDDTFVVIEELLFIDDELFRVDDPLLKNLDEELDQFLKDLLSDVN